MSFSPNDLPATFWELIDAAEGSRAKLQSILAALSKQELYEFAGDFSEAAVQLVDTPFVDQLGPGVSEDTVEELSFWIVSHGKEYYSSIWDQPALMPRFIPDGHPESLFGVAESLFRQSFGVDMPDLYDETGYPIYRAE